ncbi:putative ribonuclease H-like domain-containing protein, partial [Tanacetum coccineum]
MLRADNDGRMEGKWCVYCGSDGFMMDVDYGTFEEEKRNIASQKRAAQTTSINKLSTGRSSVSTATTPYVSAASTPTGENAGESSFVYLGGKIPIDASTLLNADFPIDLNMLDLEDNSDAFSSDVIFNGAYDDANVAIRLFLAFASYMGFTVYQMDVKSAFLYGTIEEEVYVHQPPGFVDITTQEFSSTYFTIITIVR